MSKISEFQLTKLYYSIGEVAEMFAVNASLIRFWEKEFTIIKPKKNKKGNRLFTPKDIVNFNKIYSLVKEQGYTLEGAKLALKSGELNDDQTVNQVIEKQSHDYSDLIARLENLKARLIQLK